MTYSAAIIAYAFVKKGIESGQPVTQMKLQKMVYVAQGIHLALYNEPLIKENFQAWKYGPVVPGIYHTFRFYGSSSITSTYRLFTESTLELENGLAHLDENAKQTIDFTWENLKDISAIKLSNWTHIDGSPWQKAYVEGVKDVPIPNQAIADYFKRFLIQ